MSDFGKKLREGAGWGPSGPRGNANRHEMEEEKEEKKEAEGMMGWIKKQFGGPSAAEQFGKSIQRGKDKRGK